MKKRVFSMILAVTLLAASLSACSSVSDGAKDGQAEGGQAKNEQEKKAKTDEGKDKATKEEKEPVKIVLNEVAHSIFYAPMYVAIEEGYFAEEGLDVELVTGFGADKTMTAVLSGEADIGFMGAEASIYTYNEGANDYVVNFAQLTQRAEIGRAHV